MNSMKSWDAALVVAALLVIGVLTVVLVAFGTIIP